MTRASLALLVAVSMLTGCTSLTESFTFIEHKDKPVKRDLFPATFKRDILKVIPSVVADQAGIREAYYSDPVLDPNADTYASCVRFNARDGAGQYLGVKEYAAFYYDGDLNQFVAATGDQCRSASYKPFPELERLCPAGKCK